MNKYNPNIHHRRSIRLKEFDYSCEGLYFITICCHERVCWFGKIENDYMILNEVGQMIKKWYYKLENKFPDIKCLEMIIMPNHFHCIIQNISASKSVGANLCVRPDNFDCFDKSINQNNIISPVDDVSKENIKGEHIGSPLHCVVQWFKTMTTNEYIRGIKQLGWEPFNGKLWQRNYYEYVIRNGNSYTRFAQYINNNPSNWHDDKLFEEK